jgi:hypothetical protein
MSVEEAYKNREALVKYTQSENMESLYCGMVEVTYIDYTVHGDAGPLYLLYQSQYKTHPKLELEYTGIPM